MGGLPGMGWKGGILRRRYFAADRSSTLKKSASLSMTARTRNEQVPSGFPCSFRVSYLAAAVTLFLSTPTPSTSTSTTSPGFIALVVPGVPV